MVHRSVGTLAISEYMLTATIGQSRFATSKLRFILFKSRFGFQEA